MAHVLGVGIATLDLVFELDHHPAPDEELRARAFTRRRGGNATNTLVVLAGLGHDCTWAGVLPPGDDAAFVASDLERHGVSLSAVVRAERGLLPLSCVLLDCAGGGRAIVHYRDLPEYPAGAFLDLDLAHLDWIHFEGRAVAELGPMLERAAAAGRHASLEVEKPREGIEALFHLPRVLLFSRAYARSRGFDEPRVFLERVAPPGRLSFLAWGAEGAWCREPDGTLHFRPAPAVEVVETLGAGDAFNAAAIHGCLAELPPVRILEGAVNLAARKVGRRGFDGLGEAALG